MEFKCFYMDHTQGEVHDTEVQVPKPSVLDDLLGVSSTSMDVDPSSVNGETELNAYMRMQQVVNDTDPLMWWKQHQEEFPCLARMTRQYLAVPASSASPERLFSSVGLVKSDLRGRLLDSSSPIPTLVVLTFMRCINFSWAAVLDTFGTTSSHDDVYT